MTFSDAIKSGFTNYAVFSGRASRSEYWFFALFIFLVGASLSLLGRAFSGSTMVFLFAAISVLFSLGTFLPMLLAGARRLHDSDHTGLWLLLTLIPALSVFLIIIFMMFLPGAAVMAFCLIPLAAGVALFVLLVLPAQEPNRFGPEPDRT